MAGKRGITRKHGRSEDHGTTESAGLKAIPGRRKHRKRHLILHLILRLFFVAVIVCGVIAIWKNWDVLSPENIEVWLDEKLSGTDTGSGFPVEITGSEVLDMSETNDGLAVLTDTAYILYNSNGGVLAQRQHGFSNPILKTGGKYSLIAEAGGSRLRVETRASTAVEMTLDNNIIEGAMGENGYFALATDSSQGYTSEVLVYDRRDTDNTICHLSLTELMVTDVALSPDGKSVALVGVVAENGQMKSIIRIYDFNKNDPVAEYSDTDVLLCALKYFPNGTLAAIGDKALWVVNKSGTIQQKQSYDDHQLIGYCVGEAGASVVLRNYGSSEGGELMTVNPSGAKAYTASFTGSYRSIAPCDSGVLLLTSKNLYKTNASGFKSTADVNQDGRLVSSLDSKAIILGLTSLYDCAIS